jgi:hypothetical protein
MPKPAILNQCECYTFIHYFEMPYAPEDILAELGCTLMRSRLSLPQLNGETERNIRQAPTINSPVLGKLTNSDTNNYFLTNIIVTIDNGRTYWAYGTVVSASTSIYRESIRSDAVVPGLKGGVEVGNTDVIRQYDRPDSNDVWFKLQ